MGRFTTLAVAASIAAASVATPALAAPRQMMSPKVGAAVPGYYVIRWDNTGICQIWNEQLRATPREWPSHYKVVSKPVSTFNEASAIQIDLRGKRTCTL